MKLLEKRVKLLNFSDTQLCYNHSDSTVIPEILIFLGFLENFPFELIMLAVHGLHVVIIIRKLWNYSPIICEILLNLLIIWKFLLNFECSISEIHEKLLNFLNVLHQKRKIWPSISLNHHFYGLISKKFEEFLLNFECSISEIHE